MIAYKEYQYTYGNADKTLEKPLEITDINLLLDKIEDIKELINKGHKFGAWDVGVRLTNKLIIPCNILISWSDRKTAWYGQIYHKINDPDQDFGNAVGWSGRGFNQPILILDPIKKESLPKEFFNEFSDGVVYTGEEELKKIQVLKQFGFIKAETPYVSDVRTKEVEITSLLKSKKQIILYGPPGTGKTYKTKEISVSFLRGVKNRTV